MEGVLDRTDTPNTSKWTPKMSLCCWLESTSLGSKNKNGGIQKEKRERHKGHFQKRNLFQSVTRLRRNIMPTLKPTGARSTAISVRKPS
jgi:hypothetical protein